jgi:peptide/nickel transport system substrate-binding protein
MRRRLLGAVFAVALASALAPALAHAEGGTLNIGLREDPDVLDPTLGSSAAGRIVYAAMCNKLFDIDTKLDIVPQLATGFEYADPTHLIIHLRQGVTFQDGEPMDAAAVKTSLMRDLTAKGSMRAGEINAIQSVDVVDPATIRLVLKAPAAQMLAQLADRAGIIMAPNALAAEGDKFGLHPVCVGPYAFDQRVAQDRIVLKRDPHYWDAKDYHFDQVVYHPIPNSAVRLANLQAGSLDIVEYIDPADIAAVQHDPKLKLVTWDALGYTGINFNIGNGPAADWPGGKNALVRQAFELAIDRTALIQVVYSGMFTPTVQANPPSSPMFVPEIQPPARDVAKAKALLQQAGVTLPVHVTLTTTNNPDMQQVGEVIQAMTQEAGFDVKLQALEFASSLQAAYSGAFQAYMIGWSGRSDADGNTWQLLHTGGTFNFGHYSSPDVDHLLDKARLYTDTAKRRDLYAQMWQQERRDMPLVYLWTARNIMGMKAALQGFQQVPDGLIRLQGVTLAQ